ncbi:Ccc1 family [Pseudoneurospora amorphoporcata]|uniref:Ccc1 family n=1 Tax=Pseudoneurospora amorphoporcata TaxID=241081 RepID=A0AAN6SI02_9PEZI|nr:Ccc1 family [Pseudoneurospora amorphoporcata]
MGLGWYLKAKSEAASYKETLAKTRALVDFYYSSCLSEETSATIETTSSRCASACNTVILEEKDKCDLHVGQSTTAQHPFNQLLSNSLPGNTRFLDSPPPRLCEDLYQILLSISISITLAIPIHSSIIKPTACPLPNALPSLPPPPSPSRPLISALTIAAAYFLGGLLPLLPYHFVGVLRTALYTFIATISLALFLFGYVKTCLVLEQ